MKLFWMKPTKNAPHFCGALSIISKIYYLVSQYYFLFSTHLRALTNASCQGETSSLRPSG